MIARRKDDYSQIDAVGRQIRGLCRDFGRIPRDPSHARTSLARIRELLDFLPLTSSEFDVALCRIHNACRYLESAEFGAAHYEVRLLQAVLKHHLDFNEPIVAPPRIDADLVPAPIL